MIVTDCNDVLSKIRLVMKKLSTFHDKMATGYTIRQKDEMDDEDEDIPDQTETPLPVDFSKVIDFEPVMVPIQWNSRGFKINLIEITLLVQALLPIFFIFFFVFCFFYLQETHLKKIYNKSENLFCVQHLCR